MISRSSTESTQFHEAVFSIIWPADASGVEGFEDVPLAISIFGRGHAHPVNETCFKVLAAVAHEFQKGVIGPFYCAAPLVKEDALRIGIDQPTKARLAPLLLGDVAISPDPPKISSVLAQYGGGVTVKKSSVDELKLIPADFVWMGIKIIHFLRKLLRVLHLSGNPLQTPPMIDFVGNLRRRIPQIEHLLILEDFLSVAVDNDNTIES